MTENDCVRSVTGSSTHVVHETVECTKIELTVAGSATLVYEKVFNCTKETVGDVNISLSGASTIHFKEAFSSWSENKVQIYVRGHSTAIFEQLGSNGPVSIFVDEGSTLRINGGDIESDIDGKVQGSSTAVIVVGYNHDNISVQAGSTLDIRKPT